MDPDTAVCGSLNGFSTAGTKQQDLYCGQAQQSPSLLAKICLVFVLAYTQIHTQIKRGIRANDACKYKIL